MSSSLFSILAQSGTGSDWNWFLIFIILVIVLVIALIIQARFSKNNSSDLDHHEDEIPPELQEPTRAVTATLEPEPEPETEIDQELEVTSNSGEAAILPKTVDEKPIEPDDLKKIEGIGPKVAGLMNENGIFTFAQLAQTSVEKLDQILDANKLQMMNPKSWPQQANLAAQGDWVALEKLQDELKGGI